MGLQFHAWRGPVDPVRDLHRALRTVLAGGRGTMLWHLDPAGYFLELLRLGDSFHLRVSHARQAFYTEREGVAIGPWGSA
ncbi:MAG: hypothetical protein KA795_14875 [Burkholderiaceae bacterium]|nr:hypothetical protein [Burkholderiaceae bacterium]